MPQTTVEALVRQAFERGQVPALLRGEAPYGWPMNRFVPANVPTDWDYVIRVGVVPYCGEDPSGKRTAQFYQGVEELLSGDAVDVWCAFNVYFFLCYALDEGPRSISMEGFPTDRLRRRLRECQEELTACKKWNGAGNPDGLWGEVLHGDKALKRWLRQGLL